MPLLLLRLLALLLGLGLIVGETVRSWGKGRHPLFVLDDYFIGVPLLITAMYMARPTSRRRAAFVASFAAAAGMLYGSFFSKLIDPARNTFSTIPAGWLTGLVGLAFIMSLIGLFGALVAIGRFEECSEVRPEEVEDL
ncbi:MAG: hypothetical protein ACPGXK_03425 [Phycisphaerae bacterium]